MSVIPPRATVVPVTYLSAFSTTLDRIRLQGVENNKEVACGK